MVLALNLPSGLELSVLGPVIEDLVAASNAGKECLGNTGGTGIRGLSLPLIPANRFLVV